MALGCSTYRCIVAVVAFKIHSQSQNRSRDRDLDTIKLDIYPLFSVELLYVRRIILQRESFPVCRSSNNTYDCILYEDYALAVVNLTRS